MSFGGRKGKRNRMADVKERILQLRREIEYHRQRYYTDDAPEITDFAFDALFRELQELEASHPEYYDENSPVYRVGGEAQDKFEKITHAHPLKSLTDVFSYEELRNFLQGLEREFGPLEYSVEPKIDGLSAALVYRDGRFQYGATRGNGFVGENVSSNLRTIRSLPLTIPYNGYLEVRGEIYMPRFSFDELNMEREQAGEPLFANPRNAAAGSLRQLDPKITAKRNLNIFVFNMQGCDKSFSTHGETLEFIQSCGFPILKYHISHTAEDIIFHIEEIGRKREELPYDIDGVVIKVNSLAEREKIGEGTSVPKWAVAYKFPPEKKETRLIDIAVQVGRTGVLTPNAVLEPIRLAGTNVSRATLHNIDNIHEKDIRIGDTVYVQKAGDIIPEITGVNLSKRPISTVIYEFPKNCPSCGEPVVRFEGEARTLCTNPSCPAQLLRSIEHFASKGAMNILGMGPSVIASLVDAGLIGGIADLYRLRREDVQALEGKGEKSAENLIRSIENSKTAGPARVLFGLGIPNIGEKAAKALADRFGDIHKLFTADAETITAIPDFGGIMAESVVNYFSHPQTGLLIDSLEECGVILTGETSVQGQKQPLAGKIFVLTGTLPTLKRSEAQALIEKAGGKVTSSVSKNTSYLLAGDAAGSKLDKAKELGIPQISEEEFLGMLAEGNDTKEE